MDAATRFYVLRGRPEHAVHARTALTTLAPTAALIHAHYARKYRASRASLWERYPATSGLAQCTN